MTRNIQTSDCQDHNQRGNNKGYGSVRYLGQRTSSHRAAYCSASGVYLDSIKDFVVRHKCDNPRCVNPDHLELGSHADNMLDRGERGRTARGEKSGVCKYSDKEVTDVFNLRAAGKTYKQISDMTGISISYVGLLLNNKWRK